MKVTNILFSAALCESGFKTCGIPSIMSTALAQIIIDPRNVTQDLTPTSDLSSMVHHKTLEDPMTGTMANAFAVVGTSGAVDGNPGNVLAEGAPALVEGVNHWRFVAVADSEFGCGMTDTAHFGSGWAINALYLTSNGNLAGRGALKVGFADPMPHNRVVDWYLEVSGNIVDVYIVINGTPKGHAFHLTFPDSSVISHLRPMVTFLDVPVGQKAIILTYPAVARSSGAGYKPSGPVTPQSPGDCPWKLQTSEGEAILRVDANRVGVKVANSFSVPATFNSNGSITVQGACASTMMMPPPFLQHLESQMARMAESMNSWSLSGNVLTINSAVGPTTWIPQDSSGEVVTENPFVTP
eukprot:Protomagalhaensia_wolfi_Nauph_80__408@NODE_1225_length_1647_cov_709_718284_g942_i0_p1_GENE_NODE_1225_length_1647_cov_709_718284_g942_i0NODE_1225_length_1647_cov_709_718284_g942_i0_p1_ORF_typecomplete_len354_score57_95META/PF03724_16/2_6e08_NODE_1225_length_1647_cov_709_718284_g942_i05251586